MKYKKVALYFVVGAFTLVSGCDSGIVPGSGAFKRIPETFSSNGERIYYTGTSSTGQVIQTRGGDTHMNMHRQMHGGGCASCHGVDREGGRLMPRFWIKAPALTKAALTSSGGHKHGKNAAQNHEIYDEKSLREAVINGINPAGEPLDGAMPRWIMAEEDLRDLTSYLLSLPE